MRDHAPRWACRIGAFLVVIAAFLPQRRIGGVDYTGIDGIALLPSGFALFLMTLWILAPAGIALLVGLGSLSRRPGGVPGSIVLPVVLLAAALAMATQGSMLLTETQAHPVAGTPTFALSISLFLLPILFGAGVLARLLGDADPKRTAVLARVALGVLILLDGLYRIDLWWGLFAPFVGSGDAGRLLPAAFAPPLGGLLIAAGAGFGPVERRVDTPVLAG